MSLLNFINHFHRSKQNAQFQCQCNRFYKFNVFHFYQFFFSNLKRQKNILKIEANCLPVFINFTSYFSTPFFYVFFFSSSSDLSSNSLQLNQNRKHHAAQQMFANIFVYLIVYIHFLNKYFVIYSNINTIYIILVDQIDASVFF